MIIHENEGALSCRKPQRSGQKQQSEISKQRWSNPEFKTAMSEKAKLAWKRRKETKEHNDAC